VYQHEFHPPHIYEGNACYFITAGTATGQKLLSSDSKRALFRDALKEAVRKHGITLYAWVILADHYHLLLRTGDKSPIHRFVKEIHGQSAVALNKLDGTPGRQVWRQYWDRFPRSERDFWCYLNYIHINPTKHGYVHPAGAVLTVEGQQVRISAGQVADVHSCLQQYPHSSYCYYVRRYGDDFLLDAWTAYPIPDYVDSDGFG
jgi:putative transposase